MVSAPGVKSRIAILTGPTATGKTAIALELASRHGGVEIINADSLLVYRGMNIGTAKPTVSERLGIAHHLIDLREPHEPFTAGDFHREALRAIDEIHARGSRALIVGGTGFYLKALLFGLWPTPKADPELRARLDERSSDELYSRLERLDSTSAWRIGKNDRYRLIRALEMIELGGRTPTELQEMAPKEPDPRFELWVLDRASEELYARIESRAATMLDQGLIDEVKALRERYSGQELPRALSSVGYREVGAYLEGRPPEGRKIAPGLQGLKDEISLATRQLVKSQRTWFRAQRSAHWLTLDRDHSQLAALWTEVYGS